MLAGSHFGAPAAVVQFIRMLRVLVSGDVRGVAVWLWVVALCRWPGVDCGLCG